MDDLFHEVNSKISSEYDEFLFLKFEFLITILLGELSKDYLRWHHVKFSIE